MDTIKTYSSALRRKRVILTEPERSTLLQRAKTDLDARNKLVESVLPLVLKIAGQFATTNHSLDLADLVQEGGLAAMIAVETFKPDGGANFITWTGICVRTRFVRLLKYLHREKRTAVVLSMHAPLNGDDGRTPDDILASDEPSQFDVVARHELQSQVAARLKSIELTPSERHILRARVMQDEQDQVSLKRMSVTYKVSRESMRIRQVKLLDRLRLSFEEFRRAA